MAKGFKGARAKLIEVEFNGQQYKVSPLTFDDYRELWSKFQSRKIKLIQSSVDDIALREKLIRESLSETMGATFFQDFSSTDGIPWVIYQALKRNHKEITEEDIMCLPTTMIMDLFKIIGAISGLSPQEVEEKKGLAERMVVEEVEKLQQT